MTNAEIRSLRMGALACTHCAYKTPNAVVWDFLMNVGRRGNLGSEQKQHNAQVPLYLQLPSELELKFPRWCHYSTSYSSSIRRSHIQMRPICPALIDGQLSVPQLMC